MASGLMLKYPSQTPIDRFLGRNDLGRLYFTRQAREKVHCALAMSEFLFFQAGMAED